MKLPSPNWMIRSGATDLGAVCLFNAFILKMILIMIVGL